jgi:N-acetylneuraminate synthase
LCAEIINLGNKKIGGQNPVFIIGEVAQAHDGSLGMAHAYIDAIAKTGADAVKFQTHIADEESSTDEQWRVKFSYQDKTRFDYWKRMEFTREQWAGLKKHASEVGLAFISSPFSIKAAMLLHDIGVPVWKIASGEINNTPFINFIKNTGIPLIISTGMSDLKEIDSCINSLNEKKISFAVLQCTSIYPCPVEKIGINLIPFFKKRYNCPAGLSDHSGNLLAGIAAAVYGADIIESHVVLSRDCFGPDVTSSITIQELRRLVDGAGFMKKLADNPVDKDHIYNEIIETRKLFTKSIAYAESLPSGTVLEEKHIKFVKPGEGIPPERMDEVIGRVLKRDVSGGNFLNFKDLEAKDQ